MKQIIPFRKDITFKTKIGELTSISLEDDLTLKGDDLIVGNFYIKGTYKMIDTQTQEEEYNYKIPCEIAISDEYDTFDCTIDIDDFYYEIINDEILKVSIDVAIDNLAKKEEKKEEPMEELSRKIKTEDLEVLNNKLNELEEVKIEKHEEEIEKMKEERDINPLNLITEANPDMMQKVVASDETYLTYSIYLFREGDDLDKIIEKYKINKEDLSNYNDLTSITVGSKLIIPSYLRND